MRRAIPFVAALLVAGCGNFFPNPENIVLPSGVRDYELECGPVSHGECEARARRLVEQKRAEQPTARITKIMFADLVGSYQITFSDGTTEGMIVN